MSTFNALRMSAAAPQTADNPSSSTYKTASGVQNVQMGGAQEAEQPYVRQPEVRSVGGVQRATVYGNEITVTESGVGRHDPNSGNSGILGTAVSPSGSRLAPDQVRDNSMVTVAAGGQAMQMEARAAARAGLLTRHSDGTYSESNAPAATAPQAAAGGNGDDDSSGKPKQPHEQPQEALSDAMEQAVTTLAETSSGTDQVAVANALLDGRSDYHAAIERMASQSGQQVETVRATIDGFVEALTDQAEAAVSKVAGKVDFQEWVEQARATDPEGLAAAMRQLAFNRSTAGFADLARKTVESADIHSPDEVLTAARDAGIPARKLPSGRVVLTIPGKGQVEYRTALRMGWITAAR